MVAAGAPSPLRVTYLVGAGATHACAKRVKSAHGVLMRDLGLELANRVRELMVTKYKSPRELEYLVNAVIKEDAEFEHIITFLDESVSALHRQFASDLRKVFEEVLRKRLDQIESDHGSQPNDLFTELIDLHEVAGINETLRGILSLNYDDYVENAVTKIHKKPLDLGLDTGVTGIAANSLPVLKLHGSFNWTDAWPVTIAASGVPLWIPPGIQKAKDRYPFNLIWGRAREILNCDVVRVIGCRLSSNDWDLISMLFTTRLTRSDGKPYDIEIIDAPKHAEHLKSAFPYLNVKSILEIDRIGQSIISGMLGISPRPYSALADDDKAAVLRSGSSHNWFLLWLEHKVEDLFTTLGSVLTPTGRIESFLRAMR